MTVANRSPRTPRSTKSAAPAQDDHNGFERIALLLQGGGALGAYQAGAYQALEEGGITPNWIAGISIGAINAALIAGNAPGERVAKLRRFWEMVTDPPFEPAFEWIRMFAREGDRQHKLVNQFSAGQALIKGAPKFFEPRFPPPHFWSPGAVGATSFYDTSPLKQTLLQLADFDRLNSGETRFAVGAVNIASGNFAYFDNESGATRITPEHVMASGALPPGFPPVEIDGQFYWDGGLVSNTPLQWILEQQDLDTLAFQVDLWNARGDIPKDMAEVEVRQKEILYSSRTRAATARARDRQRLRGALKRILAKLPENFGQEEDVELLSKATERRSLNVVQLIYRARKYEGASKDYDFSRLMMEEHWASGYEDAKRALGHPEIFHRPRNAEAFASYDFGQG